MSIEAMKQWLEALENATHFVEEYAAGKYIYAHDAAITSLRQAIADAEKERSSVKQEPVAFELYHHIVLKLAEAGCKLSEQQKMVLCNLKAVTSPPQLQQEPDDLTIAYMSGVYDGKKQRQWVGLTGDEVNEFAEGCHLGNSVQGAIRKAEAKLKEKNT